MKGAGVGSTMAIDGCLIDPRHNLACHCEGVQAATTNTTSLMAVRLSCFNGTLGDEEMGLIFKAVLSSSNDGHDNNNKNTVPIANLLTSVKLENVQLTQVPTALPLFSQLENVKIRNNHIQSIASGAFNFGATLRRLDLSSNSLMTIEPGAFQGTNQFQFENNYLIQI